MVRVGLSLRIRGLETTTMKSRKTKINLITIVKSAMKQSESTNSIGFLKISTSAVSGPFVKLKTLVGCDLERKTLPP